MEVAAESLLVAVSGDPHDHGVAVLAVGEELQRGTLAPDLVGGVVQVGEVLDFGDREQARRPGTERQAEDRLFVEQGVENPRRANLLHQPTGDAVDAALAGDVLAEDECLGVVGEDVQQRAVDGLRQGHRALARRTDAGHSRTAAGGIVRGARRLGGFAAGFAKRLHHCARAVELRQVADLSGEADDFSSLVFVAVENLGRA